MPVRVQLSRKKGSRMPPNTVSVARPGRWGNPYAVGHAYRSNGARTAFVTNREHAVSLFQRAINRSLPYGCLYDDPQAWELYVARARRELCGKNLACWCALDEPCHADVLLKIANEP